MPFFEDMKRRALNDPLLVTSDGARHQGDRDLLSAGGPSALPGASHAQPAGQGAEDEWPEKRKRMSSADRGSETIQTLPVRCRRQNRGRPVII
jgi:hypothetical protein